MHSFYLLADAALSFIKKYYIVILLVVISSIGIVSWHITKKDSHALKLGVELHHALFRNTDLEQKISKLQNIAAGKHLYNYIAAFNLWNLSHEHENIIAQILNEQSTPKIVQDVARALSLLEAQSNSYIHPVHVLYQAITLIGTDDAKANQLLSDLTLDVAAPLEIKHLAEIFINGISRAEDANL